MRAADARTRRALRGLHVLADDGPGWKHGPLAQAEAACRGGASVVQLRAKTSGDREALRLAARIRALTHEAGVLFVVNDRFDLALAAGADGVHLGQEDLPPARLPADARAALWVGRSTHTLEQARSACREPIHYLAFGPLFGTRSKATPWSARGPRALCRVLELAGVLPVVAIGGIDADNAGPVGGRGAGLAVLSAVAAAADPEAAVRRLAGCAAGARP